MQLRLSFEHGAILDGLPGWREVFALPVDRAHGGALGPRRRAGGSTPARSPTRPGILRHLAVWDRLIFDETFAPENADARGPDGRRGRRGTRAGAVRRAARRRRGRPPAHRAAAAHPRVGGGLGAARPRSGRTRGPSSAAPTPAPTSTPCAAPSTRPPCSGDGVRARGLLSWEQAVRLLTDVPARLYGLRDRGRLVPGAFADVVVFDPATHRPRRRAHPRRPARRGQPPLRRGGRASGTCW